jgi:formate hydrogenlyase transcriptional activator
VGPDRQLKNDNSRIGRYEMLLLVSRAISTNRNLNDLFLTLKTELARVAQFDGIAIAQCSPSGGIKWGLAEMRGKPIQDLPKSAAEDELASWVFQNQQPVLIRFTQTDSRFPESMARLRMDGIASLCILPLTTVRRRIGALSLGSAQPDTYDDEDLRFLSSVADQVAVAIDAAINLEEIAAVEADLRKSRERLQLLLSINNSVVSNLDLRELFLAVSSSIRPAMGCDLAGIALPVPGTKKLQGFVFDYPGRKGFISERTPLPPFMHEVFETRVPVILPSPRHEVPDVIKHGEGITESCHVALVGRDQTLGVMSIGRLEPVPFTQKDIDLLNEIGVQVAIAIQNALAYQEIEKLREQLARENLYLENEIRSELNFEEIIGRSGALTQVLRKVETVAPTDSTVVIYGETGTGKELIARALHGLSSRAKKPFVKLNCAAIPASLLESELFGHEKGAFTGAVSQRIGRFELASQGTVFLDEIGELPLELQPKLLRVLQEGEFERLGSSQTLRTNARLIAATNRDLLAMVREHKFRADLYYRVNVFPLELPSLRDRREDIPLLVRHFVQLFSRRMNRGIDTISSESMQALTQYSWPGNIRELQNLIERAVILSSGTVLRVPLNDLKDRAAVVQTLEESDRKQILKALDAANWVIAGPKGAAALLGLKRSTLQARMAKLGIQRARAAHDTLTKMQ